MRLEKHLTVSLEENLAERNALRSIVRILRIKTRASNPITDARRDDWSVTAEECDSIEPFGKIR